VLLGVQFCKLNAEKSPYLVEKLNIWVMPTLVLIKEGKTVHHIRGFDELGATPDFSSDMLAYVLSKYKVLTYEGGPPDMPNKAGKMGVNSVRMAIGKGPREGLHERGSDDEGDDY
jgi:hypothetical protein